MAAGSASAVTKAVPKKPAVAAKRRIQTKLDVGPAGDHFEREADSVARKVNSGGDAPVAVPPTITPLTAQRMASPSPAPKEEEKKPAKRAQNIQRKAAQNTPPPKEEEMPKSSARMQRKVQRKTAARQAPDEEMKAAKSATSAQRDMQSAGSDTNGGVIPQTVENTISRMQSGPAGRLDSGTKSFMESRFGRDFSNVRVHKDSSAAEASQALNAKAFTVGNDVFFNSGEYRPDASSGRELIAHELTHTVQQAGGGGNVAAPKRIQREPKKASPTLDVKTDGTKDEEETLFQSGSFKGASVDTKDPKSGVRGVITIPTLGLPVVASAIKGAETDRVKPVAASNFALPVEKQAFNRWPVAARGDGKAFEMWTAYAQKNFASGIKTKLDTMIEAKKGKPDIKRGTTPIHFLTFKGKSASRKDSVFFGTSDEISNHDLILRPQWSRSGSPGAGLDADHIMELQVGGADAVENMWLLKGSYNRSVGSKLKTNMNADLKSVLKDKNMLDKISDEGERPKNATEIKRNWLIKYSKVSRANFGTTTKIYWTKSEIKEGKHLDHLKVMNENDLVKAGLMLRDGQKPGKIKIFPTAAGGKMVTLSIGPDDAVKLSKSQFLYNGIYINSGTYHHDPDVGAEAGPLMSLNVSVFKKKKKKKGQKQVIEERQGDIKINRVPGLGIAGYVSKESIRSAAGTTRFKLLSPLSFTDLSISPDGNLTGIGEITSDKSLLKGVKIPLMLVGDQIRMDFPLPVKGFNLGPVKVDELGMGLGIAADELFVEGYALFHVDSLGSGSVTAQVGEAGPILKGEFNFDLNFVDPASLSLTYNFADDTLSGTGDLGVKSGIIPGVDSGSIHVEISNDKFDVTGQIHLGGPLKGISLDAGYTEKDGLTIGVKDIALPLSKLPSVKDAKMSISATRNPDTGDWSFSGLGQATLAVPGASGSILVGYRDGLINMMAIGKVQKGPATGNLTFTASNGAIDEDGKPIEGQIGDAFSVWGKGSVSIAFGNILTGTAGIEYTSDNRIILDGEIALPPTYTIPNTEKKFNDPILKPKNIYFPIVGAKFGPIGVGIFGFGSLGLDFKTSIGPAQIKNAKIKAKMDLDRPDEAVVTGGGQFYMSAESAFVVKIRGGLSAEVLNAYLRGSVGIDGEVGAKAEFDPKLDISWSKSKGLAVDLYANMTARPSIKLTAVAEAKVGVDLLFTDLSHIFARKTWPLADIGSNMAIGLSMPVKWSEAEGLDLSLDKLAVKKPSFDIENLVTGAAKKRGD